MKAPTMALFIAAFVALTVALFATEARSLLQGSAVCQSASNALVNDCGQFLGQIQSAQASQPQLANGNDAQIQAAIGGQKPSPTCCSTSQKLLSNGCRCDPGVQQLAAGLNIQPAAFYTIGRAAILACGLPTTTDTAPRACPTNPAAGK